MKAAEMRKNKKPKMTSKKQQQQEVIEKHKGVAEFKINWQLSQKMLQIKGRSKLHPQATNRIAAAAAAAAAVTAHRHCRHTYMRVFLLTSEIGYNLAKDIMPAVK